MFAFDCWDVRGSTVPLYIYITSGLLFTGAGGNVGTVHGPGLDLVHGHTPGVTLVHAGVGTKVVIGHAHRFQTERDIKETE